MNIEELYCTCGNKGKDAVDHAMGCLLWEDEEFEHGYAEYDAQTDTLVYLEPGTSFHDTMSDDAGPEAPEDEPDEDNPQVTFDDACEIREGELFDEWVEKDTELPNNYTLDGVSRVYIQTQGDWTTQAMGCYCAEPDAGENCCLRCNVWRPGKNKDGKKWYGDDIWRPLEIKDEELACRCPGVPKTWQCGKCGVKRTKLDQPFTAWTPIEVAAQQGGAMTYSSKSWGTQSKGRTVTYELCRHVGRPLVYPNGLTIYGSPSHGDRPAGYEPEFGIYLDKSWEATCLAIQVPWPDMSVPKLADRYMTQLTTFISAMLDKGTVVEVGCIGGHGRTGTLLAVVGLENGIATPAEAIVYVRENYCKQAIESKVQEWYIEKYYAIKMGLPVPEMPKVPVYGRAFKGENAKLTVTKKNDSAGKWYCPGCNKDVDDGAELCEFCLARFTNPGVRPFDEWDDSYTKRKGDKATERIAKATLKAAEAKHGVTSVADAVDVALDKLDKGDGPHIQSRLPFTSGSDTTPGPLRVTSALTMELASKLRMTQPRTCLTTFEHEGRTYLPTWFDCGKCGKRLHYKVRYASDTQCFRMELVHSDNLTKITRCKGGKK